MKSVCIIGGGVIGLCSAYELSKRGFEVTILERSSEETLGCSHGNAGMVVPSHFIPLAAPGMIQYGLRMMLSRKSPFGVHFAPNFRLLDWTLKFARASNPMHVHECSPVLRDLNVASRAAFVRLADDLGEGLGFTTKGLLMLCRDQATLDAEAHVAEQANRLGLLAKVLVGKELAEADPDVTMQARGAIHFIDDCHLSPHAFMLALRRRVTESGVKIVYNSEVTEVDWAANAVRTVRTSNSEYTADEFVLATGSWSEALGRKLKLKIPIQPGKGYSMTVKNPVQLPQLCSIFTEARVAVTPMNGELRFAGTMEIGAPEHGVNALRVQGIRESINQFFPAFSASMFEGQPIWSGLRPCSPDGMPYIGRTKSAANLTVATGHSMMGFSLGPVTGELVGQLVNGETPQISLNLLDPDRYR